MYCPKCGTEIPDTAAFCPNCGAAIQTAPAEKPADPAAEAKKQKRLWLVLAAIVLVLAIVFGVTFGVSRARAFKPAAIQENKERYASQTYDSSSRTVTIQGDADSIPLLNFIDYKKLSENHVLQSFLIENYNDGENFGALGKPYYGFAWILYAYSPWIQNGNVQIIRMSDPNAGEDEISEVNISFNVEKGRLYACTLNATINDKLKTFHTNYSYNDFGDLTEVTADDAFDEDHTEIIINYSDVGEADKIWYHYGTAEQETLLLTCSPAGQLTSIREESGNYYANYQYDSHGMLTEVDSNSTKNVFQYQNHRLISWEHSYQDEKGIMNHDTYTWVYESKPKDMRNQQRAGAAGFLMP